MSAFYTFIEASLVVHISLHYTNACMRMHQLLTQKIMNLLVQTLNVNHVTATIFHEFSFIQVLIRFGEFLHLTKNLSFLACIVVNIVSTTCLISSVFFFC